MVRSEPGSDRVRLLLELGFFFFFPVQQQDEMKRKKVMHIAQEIMSSEKV